MRSNFTVQIPGACIRNGVTQGYAPDAEYCQESVVRSKRLKPRGFLLPLPYTFTRTRYKLAYGSANYSWPGYPDFYRYTGVIGNGTYGTHNSLNVFNVMHIHNHPSHLDNAALINARNSLKNMDVNLGQAFLERNQAVSMVSKNAKSIVSLISALKHGNVSKALKSIKRSNRQLSSKQKRHFSRVVKNTARSVPSRWLEVQYGWKPLLQDIHGVLESLDNQPLENYYFTCHGTSKHIVDLPFVYRPEDINQAADGRTTGVYLTKYTLVGLPSKSPVGLQKSYGITNPALLAWELLPYSFVVDWFLPIGDYLSSLDATLGFTSLTSCCTRFAKLEWKYSGANASNRYGESIKQNNSAYKQHINMVRTVQTGVPMPEFPGFKDPRSLGHMANALALLAVAFKDRR